MSAVLEPRIAAGMARQLDARTARLERGERPLGWKLGFGTSAAMEKLGIEAPLVAYLTDSGLAEPGSNLALDDLSNPKLEPEIALHLGSDLSSGTDRDAVAAAVAGVGPAFELVDLDPEADDVEAILAGGIFHRHVVLGETTDPERLGDLRGELIDPGGERLAIDDPAELTGSPLGLLAHVAEVLEAQGETLRAGEVVICGSMIPPPDVSPGDEVELRLGGPEPLRVGFA